MSDPRLERLKATVERETSAALALNKNADRHQVFEAALKAVLNSETKMAKIDGG